MRRADRVVARDRRSNAGPLPIDKPRVNGLDTAPDERAFPARSSFDAPAVAVSLAGGLSAEDNPPQKEGAFLKSAFQEESR
jgi:hypothetical protein